ncbi:hypothetical protein CKO44_06900 [Rubrivivax gelatinosus]|uniref:Uncharacterized protein n=1 Tax=Rubrivivax gelatinosus TaxID=28068 RepID=A0ABS1DTN0_RUBGE|nr:hypothetical protein [Rubrivivax gelatinosus]MBK1613199.1 hypothetical protein [Rubrivivax gelatinosus]MBK1712714.1 hypothetical protein [Rubrivivax gelatinosus]
MKPVEPRRKTVEIVLIALLLALVTNPELRAFLLLAEAAGLELLVFSAWVYGRHQWLPTVHLAASHTGRLLGAALPRREWAMPVFYAYPAACAAGWSQRHQA